MAWPGPGLLGCHYFMRPVAEIQYWLGEKDFKEKRVEAGLSRLQRGARVIVGSRPACAPNETKPGAYPCRSGIRPLLGAVSRARILFPFRKGGSASGDLAFSKHPIDV